MKKKNEKTVNLKISKEAHDDFIECQKLYMKKDGQKYNLHRLFEKVVSYTYNGLKREVDKK